MSPPRTRTLAVPIVKFEDFVNAGGNPKEFWAQPGVKRKLGTVWLSIENLEESACDNQAGIEMIPASLTKVANTIGVSPEMICDWIGQDIVYRRRLNRNKMKIAPNGVAISMRPKYEEFIDNECGKAGDFWNQVYVKNIVKEAQMSKVPRVVAAEKLGVKVGTLVEKIKKLNEEDEYSDYEKARQENIADRLNFFGKLNFNELKTALKLAQQRQYKKQEQLPMRPKSVRIQKMALRKSTHAGDGNRSHLQKTLVPNFDGLQMTQTLSILQNRLEKRQQLDAISELIQDYNPSRNTAFLDRAELLEIVSIAKLTHGHIQACDVHPGKKLFMVVGDNLGEIGCWLGPDKFINLRPHSDAITDLSFIDSADVVFSSIDGYMKRLDFIAQGISVQYEPQAPILWHQKIDAEQVLIGHETSVQRIDMRTRLPMPFLLGSSTNGTKMTLMEDQRTLAGFSPDKFLKLFDLRFLKADDPLEKIQLQFHGRSALFNYNVEKPQIALTYQDSSLLSIYDYRRQILTWNSFDFCDKQSSIAWHPAQRSTLFTTAGKDKEQFYSKYTTNRLAFGDAILALRPEAGGGQNNPLLAAYSNYAENNDSTIQTFRDKHFMVVLNGLCQGSVTLFAKNDTEIFY